VASFVRSGEASHDTDVDLRITVEANR